MQVPVNTKEASPRTEALTWLSAAVPVAAALLGLAGLSSGQALRIAQLYPKLYLIGLLLLLGGVVAGVLGLARLDEGGISRTTAAGLIAFVLGISGLVGLNALVVSKQDRPVIAPSLTRSSSGLTLKTAVTAAGMKHDQYIFLLVQGYNSRRQLKEIGQGYDEANSTPVTPGLYSKQRIYISRIGPRADGTIDSTFEVPVNEEWYEQIFVQAAFIDEGPRQREDETAVIYPSDDSPGIPCQSRPGITCATIVAPLAVVASAEPSRTRSR